MMNIYFLHGFSPRHDSILHKFLLKKKWFITNVKKLIWMKNLNFKMNNVSLHFIHLLKFFDEFVVFKFNVSFEKVKASKVLFHLWRTDQTLLIEKYTNSPRHLFFSLSIDVSSFTQKFSDFSSKQIWNLKFHSEKKKLEFFVKGTEFISRDLPTKLNRNLWSVWCEEIKETNAF